MLQIRKSTFVQAEMILTNILKLRGFQVQDQISSKNEGERDGEK